MTRHLVAIFAAAHLLLQGSTIAQGSFSSRVVVSGLSAPWEILVGPDDHLWISERTGRRVIRINRTSGAVFPALDLTSDSYDPGDSWHEGLLGVALHPDLLKKA